MDGQGIVWPEPECHPSRGVVRVAVSSESRRRPSRGVVRVAVSSESCMAVINYNMIAFSIIIIIIILRIIDADPVRLMMCKLWFNPVIPLC